MGEVFAVAESVWRRILTMKAVYFLIVCAIGEIGITILYKWLMAMHQRKLMVDVSQLMITLAALLCVLALAFDIPRELREGRVAALLSKPLGRPQYLLGKWLGIVIVGVVVTSLISCGFFLVHHLYYGSVSASAVRGHILAVASVLPMATIALLFASLLGEVGAAVFTTLAVWGLFSVPALTDVPIIFGGLIPNFNLFNMRAEAAYNVTIPMSYVLKTILWSLLYSAGIIALTGIFFNRRDLQ